MGKGNKKRVLHKNVHMGTDALLEVPVALPKASMPRRPPSLAAEGQGGGQTVKRRMGRCYSSGSSTRMMVVVLLPLLLLLQQEEIARVYAKTVDLTPSSCASNNPDYQLELLMILEGGTPVLLNANVADGYFQALLTYTGTDWIGFGPSPTEDMIGGDVIIMSQGVVKEYDLNAESFEGINQRTPTSLSGVEVVQQGGQTTVAFTRPLVSANGGNTIRANGYQAFILAKGAGGSGVLEPHTENNAGAFGINFSGCAAYNPDTAVLLPHESAIDPGAIGGCEVSDDAAYANVVTLDQGNLLLYWSLIGDSFVSFQIRALNGGAWLGMGFSDASGAMIGSDSVVCSDGVVQEYRLAGKTAQQFVASVPTGISDASCLHTAEMTELKFTRSLKSANGGKSIDPTGETPIIFATGVNGEPSLSYHGPGGRFSSALTLSDGCAGVKDTVEISPDSGPNPKPVPGPTDSSGAVDCASDDPNFQNFVALTDTSDIYWSIDETEGTFSAKIVSQSTGWLGFGVSTTGEMDGSDAVIFSAPNNGATLVAEYTLGVNGADAPRATGNILSSSVEQLDGVTTLAFKRNLVSTNGGLDIAPSGRNYFLIASGDDNTLGYHTFRAPVQLDLGNCEPPAAASPSLQGALRFELDEACVSALPQQRLRKLANIGAEDDALMRGSIIAGLQGVLPQTSTVALSSFEATYVQGFGSTHRVYDVAYIASVNGITQNEMDAALAVEGNEGLSAAISSFLCGESVVEVLAASTADPGTCTSEDPAYAYKATVTSAMTIYYSVDEINGTLSMRVVHKGADGYIALGVNTSPKMVGSDVIIASTWGGVYEYDITAKSTGGVIQRAVQSLESTQVTYENGVLTAEWTRPLTAADAAGIDIAGSGLTTFVWAVRDSPSLGIHDSKGSFELDLAGCPTDALLQGQGGSNFDYMFTHGIFMTIAWGIISPTAVLVVRFCRGRYAWWFKVHRALQMVAVAMACIGAALGITGQEKDWGEPHFHAQHGKIGISVVLLGIFQIINGTMRPHAPEAGKPKTRSRFGWELLHRSSAISALLMAWMNIVSGLDLYNAKQAYKSAVTAIFTGFACLALVALALSVWKNYNSTKRAPPAVVMEGNDERQQQK